MNTNTQPTNQQPQHSNCSILRNQSPGTALMVGSGTGPRSTRGMSFRVEKDRPCYLVVLGDLTGLLAPKT